jgi:membrane protein implicated in regulation of membrane protease activity
MQAPAGTVVGAVDAVATALAVGPTAAIGVGSLLIVGTERVQVTGRSMAATGQTLAGALDAQARTTRVPVQDGAAVAEGETILIDGERMRVTDVAGTTLIVTRAWDGTALAAHDAGVAVYALRALTVARGVLGTTAAPIPDGTALTAWQPPGGVRTLTIAEATNTVQQEQSGYARTLRSGSGSKQVAVSTLALGDLRDSVYARYGRQRMGAI